ncbi:MAG TPA: AmmeMemoRadiSam system radical SAM enzyme [Methanomassiliicoccales archaeon]|nr:AmmeMemoRadiSam system radical SAM enzyme [Methanomassiliicoccales archaeon]
MDMAVARYWVKEGDKVRCGLCPHSCLIAVGRRGICGVRENVQGTLEALTYGMVSSMHLDPMEKKPLYHFKPGQTVLSFGSVGCNMGCQHCQNFSISQTGPETYALRPLQPEEIPLLVKNHNCRSVAWTYNEPTIWHEFVTDASRLCKQQGMSVVFVSNGYIQEAPLRDLEGVVDAMNIDVKAFHDDFYKGICKAKFAPVVRTVEVAHEIGIHVELTYLIIPGKNDDAQELKRFCEWAQGIDPEIPVHFSRFHPDYKMTDVPATPMKTMEMAHRSAQEAGLKFIYLGNMRSSAEDTTCPDCGSTVIRRSYYDVEMVEYDNGRCRRCGRSLGIVP